MAAHVQAAAQHSLISTLVVYFLLSAMYAQA